MAGSAPLGSSPRISGCGDARLRLARHVCLAVAIVAAAVWFTWQFVVAGWLVPVRLSGASMAPWLLGEHHKIACVECAFPFAIAGSQPPRTAFVRCPNCDSERNAYPQSAARRGQRVLIEKWPLRFRSPRRWEVVAMDDPDCAERFLVKRVVGLPGETVQIVDGGVRINRETVPRSLKTQRQMAWVVNDDRYRRTHNGHPVSRWRPERSDSKWRIVPDGFERTRANGQNEDNEVDWLIYHHLAAVTGSLGKSAEHVVLDDIALNQTARRGLHAVMDLALTGDCQVLDGGELLVRQETGQGVLLWVFDFSHDQITLRSHTEVVGAAELRGRRFRFRIGVCDRDAALWIDDQVILTHRLRPREMPAAGTSQPFALGGRAVEARIRGQLVERDTYVTVDAPSPVEGSWRLDEDEYFLLGDNSPVSRDSRQWSHPVRRRHIWGLARRRPP